MNLEGMEDSVDSNYSVPLVQHMTEKKVCGEVEREEAYERTPGGAVGRGRGRRY